MNHLAELLSGVNPLEVRGPEDVEISNLAMDSRKVGPGSLYVAVVGLTTDGHRFIDATIQGGAKAIVCERLPAYLQDGVTYIRVENSSIALGQLASNFYGCPSSHMRVIGITGTNGKTTTATLLARLFRTLGYGVGLLSTIRNQINEDVIPSTHTTGDAIQINSLMQKMVEAGCTYCFMEVTSHAVHQHRIDGLKFGGAVFTNLSHDHLDYHSTLEEYFAVKKSFFDSLADTAFALTNSDDPKGLEIVGDTLARVHSYGLSSEAEFSLRVLDSQFSGLTLEINDKIFHTRLRGHFNAYNLLAVYATAVLLGQDRSQIVDVLGQVEPVTGRFDCVYGSRSRIGVVDFSHTPDGLVNVLRDIRQMRPREARTITVLGCGGDRDKTKRPLMAEIAYSQSDRFILTTDNPRSEDPKTILEDMIRGLPTDYTAKGQVIEDREEAIKAACMMAREGDIVLVAGKGHEEYQEIGSQRIPFSDRRVLETYLVD